MMDAAELYWYLKVSGITKLWQIHIVKYRNNSLVSNLTDTNNKPTMSSTGNLAADEAWVYSYEDLICILVAEVVVIHW